MKNLFLFLLIISASGCVSTQSGKNWIPNQSSTLMQVEKDDLLNSPTGKFYVTYIPLLFPETKDVRESKHQMLVGHIAACIQKPNFTSDQNSIGDWEVMYHYSTYPASIGTGFDHSFEVEIRPTIFSKLNRERKWKGLVTLRNQELPDITIYLPLLVPAVFKNYPYKN
jgi:hypothetical protein